MRDDSAHFNTSAVPRTQCTALTRDGHIMSLCVCVCCVCLLLQLARHEASKVKPGSLEAKARRPDVQYAKK